MGESYLHSAVFSGLSPSSLEFLLEYSIQGLAPAHRRGQTSAGQISTHLCPRPQSTLVLKVLSSPRCALSFLITENHEAVSPIFYLCLWCYWPQSTKFQIDNSLYCPTWCNCYSAPQLINSYSFFFVSFINYHVIKAFRKNHRTRRLSGACCFMPPD